MEILEPCKRYKHLTSVPWKFRKQEKKVEKRKNPPPLILRSPRTVRFGTWRRFDVSDHLNVPGEDQNVQKTAGLRTMASE
jgi:hypothetical protein